MIGRRKRKLVRLHLEDRPGVPASTLEGVLDVTVGGRYLLLVPKMVVAEGQTVALEGVLEVPADRVVFVQVIG